jgi:uncharacterized membrane protein
MKGKQILAIAVIVIASALAIVGYIVLPDTLVMQVTASGSVATTMPKLLGLAIPTLISVGAALYFLFNKNSESNKSLWVSLIGILAFILTYAFNIRL